MRPHQSIGFLRAMTVVVLLMLGCTRNQELTGATTETTNGISGSVRNSDDSPAPNTIVQLFPENYDPVSDSAVDKSFIDTTDDKGKFSFNRVVAGNYSVLARSRDLSTSFRVSDIPVVDDTFTKIPPATLDKSGSIAVLFLTDDSFKINSYVYLPGTNLFSTIRSDGSAFLGNVPAGIFSKLLLNNANSEKRNVLREKIVLVGGDTVTIDNPLWKYSRQIIFNTTATGAGVNGDVHDFPVLIRLNAGNFDFTQSHGDGSDVRFASGVSKQLRFEIERWDAIANRAEIWVNIDTVYGNDSSQSIMMYWGNSEAPLKSIGAGVFDTTDGFQGVWHLSDAAEDSVRDATANRYCGVSPDTARPAIAEGVIGNCRVFDGKADFITMPNTANSKLNFPESGQYTVSAWVYLDTLDDASHCIVSKGHEQYYLRSTCILKQNMSNKKPLWEFVEFSETVNWQTSTSSASGRQWALITGVRQGDKQMLYCNGELVTSLVDNWDIGGSRNTSKDLSIGKFLDVVTMPPPGEGYCFFKGSIDEVRILSKVQSPDWVRLCYQNQRPDDRLVVFR
jgi:hypothetical protein